MAVRFDEGQGVPQGYAEAPAWFRWAAEQGTARAQFNLGLMSSEGDGVPQDAGQAASWYRRATEQGHVRTQYALGVMHAEGVGVPQDAAQAYAWLNVAAACGDRDAEGALETLGQKMTEARVAGALGAEPRPRGADSMVVKAVTRARWCRRAAVHLAALAPPRSRHGRYPARD